MIRRKGRALVALLLAGAALPAAAQTTGPAGPVGQQPDAPAPGDQPNTNETRPEADPERPAEGAVRQAGDPAADDGMPGDIIVTAERRSENVQDVPIAVSVLSAQELIARSVENVGDAITVAPNVARTGGANGRGDANFFVRGVGQTDNAVTVDPGVGVYLDEVYLARLQGASFDLFDIERIEVLRGPQGTLWGKNTIGGAINIVTRDPQFDELTLRARALYGSRDRVDLFGTLNIPISEEGAASISGLFRRQRGWARNAYTGETQGDIETEGARAKLRVNLTDDITVKLSADYIHDHGTPVNQVLTAFNPNIPLQTPQGPRTGLSPTGVPFPAGFGTERGDRNTSFNSIPLVDTIKNGGVSANIAWDVSDTATLKSITAYRELTRRVNNDFDGTGFRLYDQFNRIQQSQVSQELQLAGSAFGDRMNYVAGLFYINESADNLVRLCTGTNGPRLTGACLFSENNISVVTDSYAAFGNVSFDVTDRLSVTAGIRYTFEEREQVFSSVLNNTEPGGVRGIGFPIVRIPPGTRLVQIPAGSRVQADFDAWTPKVSVDYKATDDLLLYGSYAQGFKSGGFTGRPSQAVITAYDPETIETYEIGMKATLRRGLFLNLAAFTSDYRDIQLLIQIPPGLFDTDNAGSARINGVEAELFGQVTRDFGVNLSVGFLDAEYREISPRVRGVSFSDRLPLISRWQVSAGAQYRVPIDETTDFTLRGDYNYRSTFSYQLENDPGEIQDGFGLLNLRGQLNFGDGKYSLALLGLNVTDERYFLQANDGTPSNGVALGIPARPAEWALEFQVRF
jgi:iron complex outermembrane receptor protein